MKIVGFVGSARKNGATATEVKKLVSELAVGGEEKLYYLNDLNINCCIGCEYCRKNEDCSQKDDMATVLEEIKNADAVVIGTPVYFGQMSAITKKFADRLYPLYRGKGVSLVKGKPLYLVYSQHSSPETYSDVRKCDDAYLYGFLGFDIVKAFVNSQEV